MQILTLIWGGFRGGGRFPSGIRPPADPKEPPLYYFPTSIVREGP